MAFSVTGLQAVSRAPDGDFLCRHGKICRVENGILPSSAGIAGKSAFEWFPAGRERYPPQVHKCLTLRPFGAQALR